MEGQENIVNLLSDTEKEQGHYSDTEVEDVRFIKPERHTEARDTKSHVPAKEVKVLLTKFHDFTCAVCDRDLVALEPIKIGKYRKKTVLFCNNCSERKGNLFVCAVCHHGCSSRQGLITHVSGVHRKLKTYKCEECDKAYTQDGSLRLHIILAHRKPNYECLECNEVFSRRGSLKDHIYFTHRQRKIKDGEKQYECAECKHEFKTQQRLTKHVNSVHLELKPFTCRSCDRSFSEKGHLNKHVLQVHFKIKFTCRKCHREFSQKAGLKEHIDNTHRKIKPFACPKCKRAFGRKCTLQRHIMSVKCNLKND